jgi:predicted metal-dependent phosphoesterase TrpH
MKIDMHVHTSERSACGKAGEEDQIRRAIAVGLNAIVLTDHAKLAPNLRLKKLNHVYSPFRIFSGIEISLAEDFLVIGLQDRELEVAQWTYPELHAYVREKEGFLILAHPFRYHPGLYEDIDQFPPDGIEIFSANTPVSWQPRILETAIRNRLTLFSNSDAHKEEFLGNFYNDVPGFPKTDRELVQVLKSGKVGTFPVSPLSEKCFN